MARYGNRGLDGVGAGLNLISSSTGRYAGLVRGETRKSASGHALYEVLGLAIVVLIALKLTGVVTWSWWWVLTPLWTNIALGILVLGSWIMMILIARRWFRRQWFKSRERRLRDQGPREAMAPEA